MADASFKESLTAARAKLSKLRVERSELDADIAKLTKIIEALKTVVEPDASADAADQAEGLTDQIRGILRGSSRSLTPPAIKERLDQGGYPWPNKGANALQSIHAVLQRLLDKEIHKKILSTRDGRAVVGYRWGLK